MKLACDVVLSHAGLQRCPLQPRRAAAPFGPPTCPFASSKRFYDPLPLARLEKDPKFGYAGALEQSCPLISGIATFGACSRWSRITDRSITFCSSRMLPGQSYRVSASNADVGIVSIVRPIRCACFWTK